MERAAGQGKQAASVVYVGLEIGVNKWVVCFSNGSKERIRGIDEPSVAKLLRECKSAASKLRMSPETQFVCVQEAGRQGFSVHRELEASGVRSLVVDSSSIEVPRKFRRMKTDAIDARALARLLIRHEAGEPKVLRVAQVPTVEQEDDRRPQREIHRLKKERTAQTNRIRALLCLHGVKVRKVDSGFPSLVASIRLFDGSALPPNLQLELLHSHERFLLVDKQLRVLRQGRAKRARSEVARSEGRTLRKPDLSALVPDRVAGQVVRLQELSGVGEESSWLLVTELFGWRTFRNRRDVAGAAGLTPTVHASSTISREQGISKSGNPRVRWMMLEVSWSWLRFQPASKLSRWYWKRFGNGSSRQRRVGIVAVARRLLVDLWRFLEQGVVPDGAVMKS